MKMKRIFSLIGVIAGLILMLSSASAQQWTSAIRLPSGGTPDMVIDRQTGNVHVLVMNNKVIHVVLDQDGNEISQEDVPGSDGPIGDYRFGASIAVDSQGQPHVVYQKHIGNNYYDAYYIYKTGSGWSNALKFSSNVWRGYGMRIAIDHDDDVHIIYGVPDQVNAVSATATYFRIEGGRITNTITNMQKWRIEDHLEIDTYVDHEVHVLLSRPDPNGKVYYHYSTNSGNSFSGPTNIREGDDEGRPGNGDLFVDLQGDVHMVYGTGEDLNRGIKPSVRYHLRQNNQMVRDIAVTSPGELESWHLGTGIGTVASSDNGRQVVVAYLTTDGGELRTRISTDMGQTWSSATSLASQAGCCEGRDKPVIRANGRRFYLAYESGGSVHVRWIELDPLPPVATAGGPYSGVEGQLITFDASNSDAEGGMAQFAWDWNNDGVYDDSTNSAIFEYAFPDDYTGTVTLRLTDNFGLVDTSQTSVTITNAAPVVSIVLNSVVEEGAETLFSASIEDPGANDTFGEVSWVFGDGQVASGATASNTYIDNGKFEVTASVTDDDGATGKATLQLDVRNVAPVADAGGPYVAVVNQPITFAGNASDQGKNDILTLEWDLNNDGIYEKSGAQVSQTYTSLGTIPIKFRATDNDGDSSVDIAEVTIGNGGPITSEIPVQQVDEGQSFQPFNLDNFVTDPNNAASEIAWSFYGDTTFAVTITNRVVSVTAPNADWWGKASVFFVAKDPTGYVDTTEAVFIANPVNDPPVIVDIPNQTAIGANAIFQPIFLDNHVTDLDDPKSALTWSAAGYSQLFVTVANRVATVTRPNTSWFGSEVITFTVRDTSNAADTLSVRFTAKLNNDPPIITPIPAQTISENQSFAPIQLDQYINDPDNNPEEISWSVYGNKELKITISIDRLVTIAPPDSEWAKSEAISFVARDPWNNADTSTAIFAVQGINDPPVIKALGQYAINEDDSIFFAAQELPNYVFDPDHPYEALQYDFIGETNLRVSFDPQIGLFVYPKADWNGQESAWLRVSDGLAWNIAQINVTVNPLPDAPKAFDLLSPSFNQNYLSIPQSIQFTWGSSSDPDAGDSISHYTWQLSAYDDFSTLITSMDNLPDTTTTLLANLFLRQPTTFQKIYWRVIAHSTDGSTTINPEHQGRFTIGVVTDVEEDESEPVPNSIALLQNYPNPFNPETQIAFDLPTPGNVKLIIYNMAGHAVRTLINSSYHAGRHRLTWDARDDAGRKVASGIYIYKLVTPKTTISKKMILMQ